MFTTVFICHITAYLSVSLLAILSNMSITSAQGTVSTEHYGSFESCTASMQEAAHSNLQMWQCEPRDEIVELELPNATYFHMIPDHVRVKRCGGTCSASV